MSGLAPKLPISKRAQIRQVVEQRRILTKLIATLQDERRRLPNIKALSRESGVCKDVVRRIVSGDPYRNAHPQDNEGRDNAHAA